MRHPIRTLALLALLLAGCGSSGEQPQCVEPGDRCNDGLCFNGAADGVCDRDGMCRTDPSSSGDCVVFLTSDEHGSDLGGLDGADAICQERARGAGLTGTFKAWLSDSEHSASDRLTHSAVPYIDTRGNVVADDWADLTDGAIQRPITVDETGFDWDADAAHCGITAYLVHAWTSTTTSGAAVGPFCGDWTGAEDEFAVVGFYCDASGTWTDSSLIGLSAACSASFSLYCVQQ